MTNSEWDALRLAKVRKRCYERIKKWKHEADTYANWSLHAPVETEDQRFAKEVWELQSRCYNTLVQEEYAYYMWIKTRGHHKLIPFEEYSNTFLERAV